MIVWLDDFKNRGMSDNDLFQKYLADEAKKTAEGDIFITRRRQIFPGEGLKKSCEDWVKRLKKAEEDASEEEKAVAEAELRRAENDIWQAIVLCLRTTRRDSSPETTLQKIARKVWYENEGSDAYHARDQDHRSSYKKELGTNKYEDGAWEILHEECGMKALIETIRWLAIKGVSTDTSDPHGRLIQEQIAAAVFEAIVPGFGPKQSRNLLQFLGLTLYSALIDSRVQQLIEEINCSKTEKIEITTPLTKLACYMRSEREIFNFCQRYDRTTALFDALAFSLWEPEKKGKKQNSKK